MDFDYFSLYIFFMILIIFISICGSCVYGCYKCRNKYCYEDKCEDKCDVNNIEEQLPSYQQYMEQQYMNRQYNPQPSAPPLASLQKYEK